MTKNNYPALAVVILNIVPYVILRRSRRIWHRILRFAQNDVVVCSMILVLAAAFFSTKVFAQTDDKQTVELGLTARAIPRVIHVGDEVRLVIQAEFPHGFSLEPFSKTLNFAPFELRGIDKPLVSSRKRRVLQTAIIRLTIFETGDFKIPSIPVAVWNIAGQRAETKTPPLEVKVTSIGKSKDDKGDIRPIKGPASVSLRYLIDWGLWALVLLFSVLLILSLYWRHRKQLADLESFLPPHERAWRELERLKENGWLAIGREKDHFSGLTDIVRRYFERRYGLPEIMEMTSAETVAFLKQKNFDADIVNLAREILFSADLVKFAKYPGDRALSDDIENKIRQIVERGRPVPEEKRTHVSQEKKT